MGITDHHVLSSLHVLCMLHMFSSVGMVSYKCSPHCRRSFQHLSSFQYILVSSAQMLTQAHLIAPLPLLTAVVWSA